MFIGDNVSGKLFFKKNIFGGVWERNQLPKSGRAQGMPNVKCLPIRYLRPRVKIDAQRLRLTATPNGLCHNGRRP